MSFPPESKLPMPYIDTIGRQLAETLEKYSADYIEVHLEESEASHITYRGKELESTDRSTPIAYVSEQLSHSSIELAVKRYGHLIPGAN